MRSRMILATLAVALLMSATQALAQASAVLYVDAVNGSDSNFGGQGDPFRTINAAYDAAAAATNPSITDLEIRVLPGTYHECVSAFGGILEGVRLVAQDWLDNADNTTTIIDGQGQCNASNGLAPVIVGGAVNRVEGFTVTGGLFTGVFGFGGATITNNIVTGNSSTFGGGIYVYTAACFYGSTVTDISNNTVTDNSAAYDPVQGQGGDGGGIYVLSTATSPAVGCPVGNPTVTVSNNTVTGNDAEAFGGGLVVFTNSTDTQSSQVTVTQNTISGNTATGAIGYSGGGAWVQTYGYGFETITVSDNTFSGNTSTADGGGLGAWMQTLNQANHTILVQNNTVTGNVASGDGGGMDLFVTALDLSPTSSLTMIAEDNSITGNASAGSVAGGGGALASLFSQRTSTANVAFTVRNNRILSNSSQWAGGGMGLLVSADADPELGGGPVLPSRSTIDVVQNLIVNNDALDPASQLAPGGGVFAFGQAFGDAIATANFELNTIADNGTDIGAGGVEIENTTDFDTNLQNEGLVEFNFSSNIVSDNVGYGIGGPPASQVGTITDGTGTFNNSRTIGHNNVSGNAAGNYEGWIGDQTGLLGNTSASPGFHNAAQLDYRITYPSPAIEGGDNGLGNLPTTDFEGDPRRFDGDDDGTAVVDMGYDEFVDSDFDTVVDFLDQCPGRPNSCDVYDLDGDNRVGGQELASLGRAFGLSSANPRAQWWFGVDTNRDGTVDGVDLANLMAAWACTGTTQVCVP